MAAHRPSAKHKTRKPDIGDTLEEEGPAFPKPIDPKRVLYILECRRKALAFVESMLDQHIEMDQLKSGEQLICKNDYNDIVQERQIARLCGYPLCANELTRDWKQQFHISLQNKKIYEVETLQLYCSVTCMNKSNTYRDENLPEQPIWMQPKRNPLSPNPSA